MLIYEAKCVLKFGLRDSREKATNSLFARSKREIRKVYAEESAEYKEFTQHLMNVDKEAGEVEFYAHCEETNANKSKLCAALVFLKDAIDVLTNLIDSFCSVIKGARGTCNDVLEKLNAEWVDVWMEITKMSIYGDPEEKRAVSSSDPTAAHRFDIMQARPLFNLFILTRYAGVKLHRTLPAVANIRG